MKNALLLVALLLSYALQAQTAKPETLPGREYTQILILENDTLVFQRTPSEVIDSSKSPRKVKDLEEFLEYIRRKVLAGEILTDNYRVELDLIERIKSEDNRWDLAPYRQEIAYYKRHTQGDPQYVSPGPKPAPRTTHSTPLPVRSASPAVSPNVSTTTSRHTSSVQCSGTTQKGNRCQRITTSASGRCYQH